MKPNIEDTDIIIRRASNGWIAFTGSEYEADHFIVTVHEEGETEWGEHEALIDLFHEHFPGYTQSKKHGGIKLEVREKGYNSGEDDGGNTKWYNCAHCDAGYPDQECTCGRTKNENKQSFTSEE